MGSIQYGDLSTTLGSLGTIAAVTYAYWSGRRESENSIKRLKRAQAEDIGAWVAADKSPLLVKLSNSSRQPIYDVITHLVLIQGAGPQNGLESDTSSLIKVLPPGQFPINFKFERGMNAQPGIEIAFTDKHGRHWIKDKNGKLEEISKSPMEYYDYSEPAPWRYVDDDSF